MAKTKIISKCESKIQKEINPEPLKVFIASAPFLFGIYYEWASGLACLFLLAYLGYCYKRKGSILVTASAALIAAAVLAVFYGISALWAVDSGMALFGLLKFLPLPVFVLAKNQLEKEKRKELLDYIPVSGLIMIILSGVLSLIPVINIYFIVNKRLAGFFQYPNTFALYLLIGIIILLTQEKWNRKNIFILLGLSAGIIVTGSRTGLILFVFTILWYCLWVKNIKVRLGMLGILLFFAIITGVYVFVTGDTASIGRYFTTSFSSSTFLGRLLYFKDSLPIIVKHPLGLGYMGYYFMQGSFQTGVYSVVNVHNELLQILLDIGWIPAGICVWAVIKGFCSGNMKKRMLIAAIILHSMLDFNLQFVSILFILFTAIDSESKHIIKVKKRSILIPLTVFLTVLSLYFGVDSALYYLKMYSAAAAVYPGNTNALMEILTESESVEDMEKISDQILVMNPTNPLAVNAKARVSYSKGNFGDMIRYKLQALEYYRYNLSEYLDYFNMLYVGYQLYIENNDMDSAQICVDHILEIPDMLEEVSKETDPIAYNIDDKPELELPEEYQMILQTLE